MRRGVPAFVTIVWILVLAHAGSCPQAQATLLFQDAGRGVSAAGAGPYATDSSPDLNGYTKAYDVTGGPSGTKIHTLAEQTSVIPADGNQPVAGSGHALTSLHAFGASGTATLDSWFVLFFSVDADGLYQFTGDLSSSIAGVQYWNQPNIRAYLMLRDHTHDTFLVNYQLRYDPITQQPVANQPIPNPPVSSLHMLHAGTTYELLMSAQLTVGASPGYDVSGETNWSFTFAAVPEPGTFQLAGLAIAGLACWSKRRRRRLSLVA